MNPQEIVARKSRRSALLGLITLATSAGVHAAPPALITPGADNAALAARHPIRPQAPKLRFAEPMAVHASPASHGAWQPAPLKADGALDSWQLEVHSPGALSVNLGFSKFRLPEGASLTLRNPQGTEILGPFTSADNDAHGQLWTPVIQGDTVIIELRSPAAVRDQVELELHRVNHGFRPIIGGNDLYKSRDPGYKSGSCNVDVVCPQGDGWGNQVRATALYHIEGVSLCTAVLLNNTSKDKRPLLLTAEHCDITVGNAPSLVTYWNYQNSTCRTPGSVASGLPGDGDQTQFNTGADLRAEYGPTDMALVELDDPIPADFKVIYAGWDRTGVAPDNAVTVHHPQGEEKRISFEDQPLHVSGLFEYSTGSATHLRVDDWDLGTTEAGSSGGPLFDASGRVVGQLSGGAAACGNNQADWYGRLSRSWVGGGSSFSGLRFWLDQGNTGAMTVNALDPNRKPPETTPPDITAQTTLLLFD